MESEDISTCVVYTCTWLGQGGTRGRWLQVKVTEQRHPTQSRLQSDHLSIVPASEEEEEEAEEEAASPKVSVNIAIGGRGNEQILTTMPSFVLRQRFAG